MLLPTGITNFASVLRIDIEVWPCAIEHVRYVGEPIALVLAENRYIAEDAIDNIKVTYQEYTPIIKTEEATLDSSPNVHKKTKTNVVSDRKFLYGNPKEAFKKADEIIKLKIEYPRKRFNMQKGPSVQKKRFSMQKRI